MTSGARLSAGSELFHKISRIRWIPLRHWFDLRQGMQLSVTIRDPESGHCYLFVADSLHAYQRARSFFSREPETISWLRRSLKPADVFLDIGANVGTYSIFAARHVSEKGHVYACEPHLPTTVQLLQNVAANALEKRISVISVAASGEDGFVPFYYKRWRQGASGSQLAVDGSTVLEKHVGSELKSGLRVDTMVAQGVIRPPNLIKIDTDGIEFQILLGMRNVLLGPQKPRSILVEIQRGELRQHVDFMSSCGYSLVASHVADKAKRKVERGHSLDEVTSNALFEPST